MRSQYILVRVLAPFIHYVVLSKSFLLYMTHFLCFFCKEEEGEGWDEFCLETLLVFISRILMVISLLLRKVMKVMLSKYHWVRLNRVSNCVWKKSRLLLVLRRPSWVSFMAGPAAWCVSPSRVKKWTNNDILYSMMDQEKTFGIP